MNGWSRRRALQGLGSSALLASLAGPATMSGRALAMGAGWGKYKGQTVRVCWPRQAHFELAKALLGDFIRHDEPHPSAAIAPWYALDYTYVMEPGDAILPRPPIK